MKLHTPIDVNAHYARLLDLDENWKVEKVDLDIEGKILNIFVTYASKAGICQECGILGGIHDRLEERTWRHLDTMQFETLIHARTPRVKCPEHGVKTIEVPWAGKHKRFTLMFEAFAIKVLQGTKSIQDAAEILKLDWHSCLEIMTLAVDRGLKRRAAEEIPFVGMDEKSFLSGRKAESFATILTDIDGSRVLDVERGRSADSASKVIEKALNPVQQYMVCGAAIDMSAPFAKAIKENLVNADVVYDKFHVQKVLTDCVDKVRRSEHARMLKKNNRSLANTKYLWLKGFENCDPTERKVLERLLTMNYQVGKAWGLKEAFNNFWIRRHQSYAVSFFDYWYKEVLASKLKPLIKAANTLKSHLKGLLNWYSSGITNAISEGFNSKIQALKSNARGFRNFENYRITILFNCGRLNMMPDPNF